MKYLALLLSLLPALAFAETAPAPLDEPTRAEIRATVLHMQQLAKDAESKAARLREDNDSLAAELASTTGYLAQAQTARAAAQQQVDALTKDRNDQAALKDKYRGDADYWHAKQQAAVKKLWWWRLWAGGAIALGVLLIVGGLLMRFTKWGATTFGPIVTHAAADAAKVAAL